MTKRPSGSCRGYVVLSMVRALENERDDASALFEKEAPALFEQTPSIAGNEYYSVDLLNDALRVIAQSESDPRARYDLLVRCGRFGAHDSLNLFFKLVMKILTPALLASKFPMMWERDFRVGRASGDSSRVRERIIGLGILGVGRLEHFVPIGEGWIRLAFESMGHRGVEVTTDLAPHQTTADDINYTVTW